MCSRRGGVASYFHKNMWRLGSCYTDPSIDKLALENSIRTNCDSIIKYKLKEEERRLRNDDEESSEEDEEEEEEEESEEEEVQIKEEDRKVSLVMPRIGIWYH